MYNVNSSGSPVVTGEYVQVISAELHVVISGILLKSKAGVTSADTALAVPDATQQS
jgi:hypothetical protein